MFKPHDTYVQIKRIASLLMLPTLVFLVLQFNVFSETSASDNMQNSVKVEMSNFQVSPTSANDITSSFEIKNANQNFQVDLSYSTEFYYIRASSSSSNLISRQVSSITLAKNESKKIDFIHKSRMNLPKGKYMLMLKIFDRSNISLGFDSKEINIASSYFPFFASIVEQTGLISLTGNRIPLSTQIYTAETVPKLIINSNFAH